MKIEARTLLEGVSEIDRYSNPHQRDPTMPSLPKYRIAAPHTKKNVRKWKRVEKSRKMCGYTLKDVKVKRKNKTQYAQRAKSIEKMNPEGPQRLTFD
jgi:hypothetical protein